MLRQSIDEEKRYSAYETYSGTPISYKRHVKTMHTDRRGYECLRKQSEMAGGKERCLAQAVMSTREPGQTD